MDVVALMVSWGGGVCGGAFMTLGIIEARSGRMVIPGRLQRLEWTRGEVRIHGGVSAVMGLALAIYGLTTGFALLKPLNWTQHAWLHVFTLLVWLLIPAALTVTPLLERHHERRWPFNRRGVPNGP